MTMLEPHNVVFPAQAGVVLKSNVQTENIVGIPRASGGVPPKSRANVSMFPYSPRKRGCSLAADDFAFAG